MTDARDEDQQATGTPHTRVPSVGHPVPTATGLTGDRRPQPAPAAWAVSAASRRRRRACSSGSGTGSEASRRRV